jgi:hypothetical protein
MTVEVFPSMSASEVRLQQLPWCEGWRRQNRRAVELRQIAIAMAVVVAGIASVAIGLTCAAEPSGDHSPPGGGAMTVSAVRERILTEVEGSPSCSHLRRLGASIQVTVEWSGHAWTAMEIGNNWAGTWRDLRSANDLPYLSHVVYTRSTGINRFLREVGRLRKIRSLHLLGIGLDEHGMCEIARCSTLEDLWICEAPLSEGMIRHISSLWKLRRMVFERCGVDDHLLAEIRRRMPDTDVIAFESGSSIRPSPFFLYPPSIMPVCP